jgi:hypothetical protein
MENKKFKNYSDYGHGWLAVKRDELKKLGILDKITHFSYQSKSGKTVYLEEDCDATLFVNTYKAKFGKDLELGHHSYVDRSPIRSYPRFELSGELDGITVNGVKQ